MCVFLRHGIPAHGAPCMKQVLGVANTRSACGTFAARLLQERLKARPAGIHLLVESGAVAGQRRLAAAQNVDLADERRRTGGIGEFRHSCWKAGERCRTFAKAGERGFAIAKAASGPDDLDAGYELRRSEEHTSELQSLMRISYDVFGL